MLKPQYIEDHIEELIKRMANVPNGAPYKDEYVLQVNRHIESLKVELEKRKGQDNDLYIRGSV